MSPSNAPGQKEKGRALYLGLNPTKGALPLFPSNLPNSGRKKAAPKFMLQPSVIASFVLLIPLAVVVIYYDVRYRRIPNAFVLAALISGLAINVVFGGLTGAASSLGGCIFAFILFFILHVFGAMGAGDVKLFAGIGAVTGAHLVLPTFVVVVLMGGILALISVIRAGVIRSTMHRVLQIFCGFLPGWEMPRFSVPADRRYTVPYGVAITLGGLISVTIFRG